MRKRLINGQVKDIDVRRTVRNWPEDIKAIVDGYRSYTTISHAVQKDAIQNGWSARVNEKGKGWSFKFELLETKGRKYLLMTDEGTWGLTGRVLEAEEYEKDLAPIERWGRFEGVSFTQDRTEGTLGSRGRGKFIFVGASKESTILYDTLQQDGMYRFGFRTVEKTESPLFSKDNEEGKKLLVRLTENNIEPISNIGARVIIVDPIDEVVSDIKSGKFIEHINETWWEIILKYRTNITVKTDNNSWKAEAPKKFDLVEEDSTSHRVWTIRNQKIRAGFRELSIKKLNIIYNAKSSIPESLRGIAIQRGGMKICAIEPRYMSREIAEKVYGYINFEPDTEELLLEDEGIEHYSFDFRRSSPGSVKRYIEDEILKFAREKLGYGVDDREVRRRKQRDAERRALAAVNNFARKLGVGVGPTTGGGGGGGGIVNEIRIRLEELILPRPKDLRINYGESVKNIKMQIVNDSDKDIILRARLLLRFYDRALKVYIDDDLQLKPQTVSEIYGPFEEEFNEGEYPDEGRYTIAARILSLMDDDKGYEYDYKSKSFYLEEDPPMKGLFERCEPILFPDDIKYWMGYSEFGSEKGLVLNYNVGHLGYLAVSEGEEELAEYILRLAIHEICRYDLMQETGVLFEDDQRSEPQETLRKERNLMGEIVYKFRKGEL